MSMRWPKPHAAFFDLVFFLLSYFNAGFCATDFRSSDRKLLFALRRLQQVFRFFERLLCARNINLVSGFNGFSKPGDLVRKNFRKTPRKGDPVRLISDTIANLPRTQLRDQRSMPG